MPPDWRRPLAGLLDRRPWLLLAATPSSYLLALALIGTLAVKLVALASLSGHGGGLPVLDVIAPDATVLGALAVLLFAGERLSIARGMSVLKWATRALALAVAVFALLNGAYLGVTGDQLTAGIVAMGWQRLHDAYGILLEELRRHQIAIGAALLAAIAIPWLARRALRKAGARADIEAQSSAVVPLAALTVCAALIWLVLPQPSSLPLARLARSALLTTYVTWFQSSLEAIAADDQAGHTSEPLVAPGSKQNPAGRFNVIVLVVESLRHDFTSMSPKAQVKTPHLLALAKRGAWSDSASTPVPHTTKALFAVHCGHMPFWQSQLPELSERVEAECLGHVLQRAGYTTAFFQSAVGAFEDRPRLVHRLGFTEFSAWENIGGEPLGYLASDDLSLAAALDGFLDRLPRERPFLATLLTSATHHPYRLPKGKLDELKAAGTDIEAIDARTRYGLLVERADALLGKVLASLERRGLTQRTLVVALGDHGEGFGEKGVRQHDNNYYEESLRVPLVIAGPGVPAQRMSDDVSLLDVAPTLLDLLGFDALQRKDALYGRNALASRQSKASRAEFFSCFYDGMCFGYVRDRKKVVVLPELQRGLTFDLAKDPGETKLLPLDQNAPDLARLKQLVRELKVPGALPYGPDLRFANGWSCPQKGSCRHPKTPRGLFFTPAIPNQCVRVKPNTVSRPDGYDHVLALHNVCSGSTECEVLFTPAARAHETVKLRPDESRELTLLRKSPEPDFKFKLNCRFL
jgi:arylsulfatase A-like enzyme